MLERLNAAHASYTSARESGNDLNPSLQELSRAVTLYSTARLIKGYPRLLPFMSAAVAEATWLVIEALDSFQGASKFSTFAFRIIENTLRRFAQRLDRTPITISLEDIEEIAAPPADLVGLDIEAILRQAKLTQRQAEVLRLAAEGHRRSEIAFRLGLTAGRVRNILYETRLKIEKRCPELVPNKKSRFSIDH